MSPPSSGGVLSRLRDLASGVGGADNVVVQSVVVHGRYYAATETPQLIEYCPTTLATLSRVDISNTIPGIKLMTPHPMYDDDGTLWNIGMAMGPDRVRIIHAPAFTPHHTCAGRELD